MEYNKRECERGQEGRIDIYRKKREISGGLCLSKSEGIGQGRENGDRK